MVDGDNRFAAAVGAAVVATLLVLLALPAAFGGWDAITTSGAAAWVQAVGSILAILAAIGIAAWQRHEDRRKEAEKERALARCKMEMVTALAEQVVASIRRVPAGPDHASRAAAYLRKYDRYRCAGLLQTFERIGPADVTTAEALVQVQHLTRALRKAQGRADEVRAQLEFPAGQRVEARVLDRLDKLHRVAARATATLREERDRWS